MWGAAGSLLFLLFIQMDKSRKNNEVTRTKQHDETTYQHTHTHTHTHTHSPNKSLLQGGTACVCVGGFHFFYLSVLIDRLKEAFSHNVLRVHLSLCTLYFNTIKQSEHLESLTGCMFSLNKVSCVTPSNTDSSLVLVSATQSSQS